MDVMMVDTTILVDYFRGKEGAKKFLFEQDELVISRVTVLELIHGVKTHAQLLKIKKQLREIDVEVQEVTDKISNQTGSLFERHYHAHGLGIMDAFIAATAMILHETLATQNIKHFRFIKDLELVKPY